MKMQKILLVSFLLCACFWASGQNQPVKAKDLKQLAKIMSGSFSSLEQSLSDSAFFHVTLRMTPIWPKAGDGYWLYVEQAMAAQQDRPYRQRVYHLYLEDAETIVSKVYELQEPQAFVNAWKDASKLAGISKDQLIDRQGCSIYLHKDKKGIFSGATQAKACLSTLRGAAYATSEVTISKDRLLSWDRGWNSDDVQVWGAVKGGYIFLKEKK